MTPLCLMWTVWQERNLEVRLIVGSRGNVVLPSTTFLICMRPLCHRPFIVYGRHFLIAFYNIISSQIPQGMVYWCIVGPMQSSTMLPEHQYLKEKGIPFDGS